MNFRILFNWWQVIFNGYSWFHFNNISFFEYVRMYFDLTRNRLNVDTVESSFIRNVFNRLFGQVEYIACWKLFSWVRAYFVKYKSNSMAKRNKETIAGIFSSVPSFSLNPIRKSIKRTKGGNFKPYEKCGEYDISYK